MCGLAGIVGPARDDRETIVRAMTGAVAHRGPDDEGYWHDADCSLGHRRLSIIDLSENGRQPMPNETGDVQVVYNGELYNFGEARERMLAAGHRFRSRTDTEVIVHLYEEHGEDFVRHIRGMFAIALWDARRRKLVLARDRFGQKPLFWARIGDELAFASEIKALLAHPRLPRDENPIAVDHFLALHFVPSPGSFYRAIHRLPPASMLVLEPDREPHIRGYWSLASIPTRLGLGEEEALEEVDRHLTRAIREQLVADVPIGLLLSGGIDSSLVLAKASTFAPAIDTFSIGYEEQRYSELKHAQSVAETFRSRHHAIVLRAEDVRDPVRLLDLFDEPFADIAALPQVALSRSARSQVKVALTGDGGDELFGGYEHHILGYWMGRTDSIATLRARAARFARRLLPTSSNLGARGRSLARALDAVSHAGVSQAAVALRSTLSPELRVALYQPEFLTSVEGERPWAFLEPESNGAPDDERIFHIGGDRVLADQFLHKTDVASMSVGLECRSPFLDLPLAEFVTSLPPRLKVRGLRGKLLLRRLLSRHVGPEISGRKKMGLTMPVDVWIRTELAPLMRDTVFARDARVNAYVRPDVVAALYDEHARGVANRRRILWALLLLELWLRRRA